VRSDHAYPATKEIAARMIRAAIPLLMEKPPGATPDEAREIVELVKGTGAWVMVSMNRRFDPALRAALDWWGGAAYRVPARQDRPP
jgi:predicted dehydrogenase